MGYITKEAKLMIEEYINKLYRFTNANNDPKTEDAEFEVIKSEIHKKNESNKPGRNKIKL